MAAARRVSTAYGPPLPRRQSQSTTGGGVAWWGESRAGAWGGNESPLQAGLKLLVAGGRAHANRGMDVRERSRAKGKSAWADKVLQMLLTSNRVTRKEVVLEAPIGVLVTLFFLCLERLSRHYLPPVAASGEKDESEVRTSHTIPKGVRRRTQSICTAQEGPQCEVWPTGERPLQLI